MSNDFHTAKISLSDASVMSFQLHLRADADEDNTEKRAGRRLTTEFAANSLLIIFTISQCRRVNLLHLNKDAPVLEISRSMSIFIPSEWYLPKMLVRYWLTNAMSSIEAVSIAH